MKTLFLGVILFSSAVWAGDIEWNGTYRIEGVKVANPDQTPDDRSKQYMLHHLVLSPKITAYDGLTIQGRFDILNAGGAYANSQMGQFFGSGIGSAGTTSDTTNALSERQASDMIAVNQLYLTYAHEFGVVTVGRAPVQFGLGMTYNAGNGAFDHWFDNRDLVAYKFVTGNLSIMPVIAKVVENDLGFSDDIDDLMVQLMYENPDSELKLGVMYRQRHAGRHGNDAPGTPVFGDGTSVTALGSAAFEGEYWNLFFQRWIGSSFKVGFEVASQSGETGVLATGVPVEIDGYGVALELDWIPKESSWNASLKAGVASGDDANTTNKYEGFVFDRNYDVAFLLFNHPIGRYDVFRTGADHLTSSNGQVPSRQADVEAISNVMYIAPSFKYKWSQKFDTQLGLTYAQLNSDPLAGVSVDKAVGFEVDITLTYKPYDNVQWVNRVGIFSPGAAFEGAGAFETDSVWGLETKAAITF